MEGKGREGKGKTPASLFSGLGSSVKPTMNFFSRQICTKHEVWLKEYTNSWLFFLSCQNALKLTYSNLQFQKFSGGETPGPRSKILTQYKCSETHIIWWPSKISRDWGETVRNHKNEVEFVSEHFQIIDFKFSPAIFCEFLLIIWKWNNCTLIVQTHIGISDVC